MCIHLNIYVCAIWIETKVQAEANARERREICASKLTTHFRRFFQNESDKHIHLFFSEKRSTLEGLIYDNSPRLFVRMKTGGTRLFSEAGLKFAFFEYQSISWLILCQCPGGFALRNILMGVTWVSARTSVLYLFSSHLDVSIHTSSKCIFVLIQYWGQWHKKQKSTASNMFCPTKISRTGKLLEVPASTHPSNLKSTCCTC